MGSKLGFLKRSGHCFIWRINMAERRLRILKMSLPRACVGLTYVMFDPTTGHLSYLACFLLFSRSVVSNSLQPCSVLGFRVLHYLPVCSNSCLLNQWCHPTISSFVVFFSCLQSFPASESFPMNQFFTSVAKVLELQDHSSSEYSGLISFRMDWFDRLVSH